MVDDVYGKVEWGENDSISVDTINGDLVRCVRVLIRVWSGMRSLLSRLIQLQLTLGLETMRVGEGDSITRIELLPIILASAVWGPAWRGQRIIVHCDNTGAITVTNSR